MATGAIRSDIGKDSRWIIGEDKLHQIDVVDDADPANPVDVSSYAMSYELKNGRADTTALLTITQDDMTVGNGAGTNDRVTFTVADTDLEGLSLQAGWYWQQLRRTDPGNEGVMLEGQVYLHDRGLPSA